MTDLTALADRTRDAAGWAADTDEVAALLESSGVNDSVAGRAYGYPSVFALARDVLARMADPAPIRCDRPQGTVYSLGGTLVRAGLHLTPTAVAAGAAHRLGTLPGYATTVLLVAGWSWAQALACLGYRVAGVARPAAAARPLAAGFGLLAAVWAGILAAAGAPPVAWLLCAAQVALFAANTAALVAGTARSTLLAALGCWVAAGALAAGATRPGFLVLAAALAAMLVLAFRPALRSAGRWPDRRAYPAALRQGLVGAGQALLFAVVVLRPGSTIGAAGPLLVGVPLTELMLVWHQRRVADGRESLVDRAAFRRHLARVSGGSGLALGLPLVLGLSLLGRPAWATPVLLAGLYALCLVLVAHRRMAGALVLMWWPVPLVWLAPGGAAVTLLCAYPPALALAVLAMRDPWSYRW
jgi:hypothetical protein